MTRRHEQIPDSPHEPCSCPSSTVLNYLGGDSGRRGGWPSRGHRVLAGVRVPRCLGSRGECPQCTQLCGVGPSIASAPGHTGQQDARHSICFVIKCLNLPGESFFFFHCHLQEKRGGPFQKKGGSSQETAEACCCQRAGQRLL